MNRLKALLWFIAFCFPAPALADCKNLLIDGSADKSNENLFEIIRCQSDRLDSLSAKIESLTSKITELNSPSKSWQFRSGLGSGVVMGGASDQIDDFMDNGSNGVAGVPKSLPWFACAVEHFFDTPKSRAESCRDQDGEVIGKGIAFIPQDNATIRFFENSIQDQEFKSQLSYEALTSINQLVAGQ